LRNTFPLARLAAGLWAALIIGGLVIGAAGPEAWRHTLAHEGPGCPFRNVTGVDCPFCGMTRATLAIGGGDLGTALAFHPLAPLVLVGMLGLMAIIIAGRGDALVKGKRPFILLGSIFALWVLRLVL
jgi:hypothetical protein